MGKAADEEKEAKEEVERLDAGQLPGVQEQTPTRCL